MDVLAEEAGVARATVYEHFGSKRAVLDAVVWSESNTITLDLARNPEADPLRALRDMLGGVCRHWAETEERMRASAPSTRSRAPSPRTMEFTKNNYVSSSKRSRTRISCGPTGRSKKLRTCWRP